MIQRGGRHTAQQPLSPRASSTPRAARRPHQARGPPCTCTWRRTVGRTALTTCIFGALTEYEWRICLSDLDARWARRHINVGESTGAAVNVAVFGAPFGMFELIQGGDNRAEGPMLLGKAKASDQRVVGESHARDRRATRPAQCSTLVRAQQRRSGSASRTVAAGTFTASWTTSRQLSAAAARASTPPQSQACLNCCRQVLEGTTDYVKPPRVLHGRRRPHSRTSAADLRQRLREEVGDGLCPSAERQNSASQVQSLSPTPPRRLPASPPPMAAGSAAPPPPLTPSPARPLRLTGNPPSRSGGHDAEPHATTGKLGCVAEDGATDSCRSAH